MDRAALRTCCGVALLSLTAALPTAGQDTLRVREGDYTLLRVTDFMTDSVSYSWARTGDEIRLFAFVRAGLYGEDVEGYQTLELTCGSAGLEVKVHLRPDEEGRALSGPESATVAEDPALSEQVVPVMLRFDSHRAEGAHRWSVRLYQAPMPTPLVEGFLASARPASRLRIRVGPYLARTGGVDRERTTDLEFSLLGFTKAVDLLACDDRGEGRDST